MQFEDGYNQALKDYESNKNLEDLYMTHALGQKGFWWHNPKMPPNIDIWGKESKYNDYKFITTKYDKGYFKALEDLEKTFIETIPDKYFTWEIDVDGSFYQKKKRDVESFSKNINESIWKVFNDYEKKAAEHSYYYLGYNICFTYDNKKYYQDFNFKDEELEDELLDNLKKLNCCDIYVKPGYLD